MPEQQDKPLGAMTPDELEEQIRHWDGVREAAREKMRIFGAEIDRRSTAAAVQRQLAAMSPKHKAALAAALAVPDQTISAGAIASAEVVHVPGT